MPYRRFNVNGLYKGKNCANYDMYFTPNFNDASKFIGYMVLG